MPNRDLHEFRQDYQFSTLEIENCVANPFEQFNNWLTVAIQSKIFEPNAMSLATVNKHLQPKVRTVLLKELTKEGFVFYTNYESAKANQIEFSNKVSLLFWWRELEQQVRIEGEIYKINKAESETYFYERPKGSQVGASISPQSKIIADRKQLDSLFEEKLKTYENTTVPFPENWGGYIVKPHYFEFWQGRSSRLHDRIAYLLEDKTWKKVRLAP